MAGTFGLSDEELDGCLSCGCGVTGSHDNTCNPTTGQCNCNLHVTGETCEQVGHNLPFREVINRERARGGGSRLRTALMRSFDDWMKEGKMTPVL